MTAPLKLTLVAVVVFAVLMGLQIADVRHVEWLGFSILACAILSFGWCLWVPARRKWAGDKSLFPASFWTGLGYALLVVGIILVGSVVVIDGNRYSEFPFRLEEAPSVWEQPSRIGLLYSHCLSR